MFYKSFIVVVVAMGIRGQPIDDQSLSVGINNMTVAVNPHRNPVQIVVVNGANCDCNGRSSTIRRRDDYQHSPGIGYHKLHTRSLDWNSARKSCQDEGGHLAIINSLAEAEVLYEMLKKIPGTGKVVYVGFHDLFKEGEWTTIFGETLERAGYDKWREHEPNNTGGTENCAILTERGLNDVNCDRVFWYICELPVDRDIH